MLLAAAVEGGAEALVTNDAEVLRLGAYRGVRILRPAQLAAELLKNGAN
jgi:predicted nucleic acid-binding protein